MTRKSFEYVSAMTKTTRDKAMTIQEIANSIVTALKGPHSLDFDAAQRIADELKVADILRNVPVEPGDDAIILHMILHPIPPALAVDDKRFYQQVGELADRYRLRMAQQQEIREALQVKYPRVSEPYCLYDLQPVDTWHEDIGTVLWWHWPIQEPPYVGTPLDCDDVIQRLVGEGWLTYWSPLPDSNRLHPRARKALGGGK